MTPAFHYAGSSISEEPYSFDISTMKQLDDSDLKLSEDPEITEEGEVQEPSFSFDTKSPGASHRRTAAFYNGK